MDGTHEARRRRLTATLLRTLAVAVTAAPLVLTGSSAASAATGSQPGYARPDQLDFARWNEAVTVADPAVPAGYWQPHRRMKQYRGGHDGSWLAGYERGRADR